MANDDGDGRDSEDGGERVVAFRHGDLCEREDGSVGTNRHPTIPKTLFLGRENTCGGTLCQATPDRQ